MNHNTRAVGCKNGEPGVLPSGVEASFFLDVLDTFSSRKKYQIIFATGKNLIFIKNLISLLLGGTHQALDNFIPLIAAGALPFSVGKKYQCRDGTTRP
jgi:hypothetical protein